MCPDLKRSPDSVESVLKRTPFSTTSLPPDEAQAQARTFVAMFNEAVEAPSEREEAWAYRKMREAFLALAGNPPIDPVRNLPAGLWEAMRWAAELWVARDWQYR
jgi:hypothetical protein